MNKSIHLLKTYAGSALAVLTVLALLAPAAFASDKYGQSERVLARVPISGPPVRQMFIRAHNGRHYLYVDQGENPGVTLVDVTNPKHPKIVKEDIRWPGDSANGQLEMFGGNNNVAMSQVREGQQQPLQPRELNLLDLTNPSHPYVLRSFQNVTAVLPDNGRNLIYVANNQGVSLVEHHITQMGWAMQHECTSEAAISAMPPDCY